LDCPSAALSKDGRLEGDVVHIDVGFIWMGGLEKEGLHGMGKREVASQSQDSLPWTAGKPDNSQREKQSKDQNSRDTFSPLFPGNLLIC
jgi:hypothetical protein